MVPALQLTFGDHYIFVLLQFISYVKLLKVSASQDLDYTFLIKLQQENYAATTWG